MKQLLFFLLLAPGPLFGEMTLARSGDENSRDFSVGNFDKVFIEGNFKVHLYQSEDPYLRVKAPSDDLYDAMEVDSRGSTLEISVRKPNFNLQRVELHIGYSRLHSLHVKGGMKLVTDGFIEVDHFMVLLEGGANVNMKMKAQSVDVVTNGGAVFDLSGITGALSVKVAGAAHVNAREMTAKEVTFRVEGVGFGSVHATDLLDVKIEGVGKVTYKGTPTVRKIIEGLGKVEEY
ncbi:MAG TPA: head GIN domain-containing protein [Prolixibacteraceae bacterium]|nr:head GIN domain-containing protein [Prolixibacteraceae bacterium]HOR99426.1 head GIN domain-containing protein [Prolixibacteraceae bacterium]HPL44569.1 head GIN domain-containing protein [Prolixibacteraceae bacterium]